MKKNCRPCSKRGIGIAKREMDDSQKVSREGNGMGRRQGRGHATLERIIKKEVMFPKEMFQTPVGKSKGERRGEEG